MVEQAKEWQQLVSKVNEGYSTTNGVPPSVNSVSESDMEIPPEGKLSPERNTKVEKRMAEEQQQDDQMRLDETVRRAQDTTRKLTARVSPPSTSFSKEDIVPISQTPHSLVGCSTNSFPGSSRTARRAWEN